MVIISTSAIEVSIQAVSPPEGVQFVMTRGNGGDRRVFVGGVDRRDGCGASGDRRRRGLGRGGWRRSGSCGGWSSGGGRGRRRSGGGGRFRRRGGSGRRRRGLRVGRRGRGETYQRGDRQRRGQPGEKPRQLHCLRTPRIKRKAMAEPTLKGRLRPSRRCGCGRPTPSRRRRSCRRRSAPCARRR